MTERSPAIAAGRRALAKLDDLIAERDEQETRARIFAEHIEGLAAELDAWRDAMPRCEEEGCDEPATRLISDESYICDDNHGQDSSRWKIEEMPWAPLVRRARAK